MKNWSTDKIIAVGMMAALLTTVITADAVAVMQGDMSITSLGKEIVIGLFGYIGRGGMQSIPQNEKERK